MIYLSKSTWLPKLLRSLARLSSDAVKQDGLQTMEMLHPQLIQVALLLASLNLNDDIPQAQYTAYRLHLSETMVSQDIWDLTVRITCHSWKSK